MSTMTAATPAAHEILRELQTAHPFGVLYTSWHHQGATLTTEQRAVSVTETAPERFLVCGYWLRRGHERRMDTAGMTGAIRSARGCVAGDADYAAAHAARFLQTGAFGH